MKKLIQEFTATDDQGHEYRLRFYQEYLPDTKLENGVPGVKRIVTEDGKGVNRLGKGQYKIVQTGVILHSDDPSAP